MHVTGWSRDLSVEIGGHDVINHTGAAALRLLADRTGLTGGLSRALTRRDFGPVHDRGRVLTDTAVLIADGGRVLADLATLRDQAELFGPVVSDPTLWRALNEIGALQRHRIARARAKTREHVWSLIAQRHGQIPPSRVAEGGLDKTVVIRMDASLVIAHSDKQLAAGTYKGTWGHHPLMARCDNTGESLALKLRGWRYQLLATNTPHKTAQFLKGRHRPHARVEDNIRCGKQTGLGHLPSTSIDINRAWCLAATIAADLLC